jgi:DNA repair exonuclease SbcCD ATPase subunit
MINKIIAKQFKGLSFEQPIGNKTIFIGDNGSGKSSRTQAITLALLGYIPGSSKLNEEILTNYGSTDMLVVGFELSGTLFERAWQRELKDGSVKEKFQVNKKPCKKDSFIQKLGECGYPRIFDLSLFMDLSDQKKIDFLLDLYPIESGVNLSELESMIETNKKNILLLEDKARSTEKAAAALIASKATMKLPAGSLAETTAAIEKAEAELETATKELNEIVSANAAEKAKADAETKAEGDRIKAEKKAEDDRIKAEQKTAADAAALAKKQEIAKQMDEAAHKAEIERVQKVAQEEVKVKVEAAESEAKEKFQNACVDESGSIAEGTFNNIDTTMVLLQSILDIMDASGCEVCAAKMAIRKEMKNYARN